jgi:hypothetical protein
MSKVRLLSTSKPTPYSIEFSGLFADRHPFLYANFENPLKPKFRELPFYEVG